VTRLAVLSGSSLQTVDLPAGSVVLAAPPPLDPIGDVAAAVRDALRFPLAGPALADVADHRARATIVVEPPVLPLPGAPHDPRRDALAAVVDELDRIGVRTRKQTILLAGGLGVRAGRKQLDALLRPERAREFHGDVIVHDCEDESLLPIGDGPRGVIRASRTIVETDLVVLVTAAETALHGGPAALLGACGAETPRSATRGESLLELSRSPGWTLARVVADHVGERVTLVGVSLALDHPRPTGRLRGWPADPSTRRRLAHSHLRRVHNALPTGVRRRVLQALGRELAVAGIFAGPPADAHAEALVRGVALRAASLVEPVGTLVVPIAWTSATAPRDAVHPLAAATVGLGVAARLWRQEPPLVHGGAIVLAHSLRTAFARASTHPYRLLYEALRSGGPPAADAAEQSAAADVDAIAEYRAGRAPHPLAPFADWDACAAALTRADRVIVGGCRDAVAARALGFVPSHNLGTAIEMAQGIAGVGTVAALAGPPYAPIVVGGA
jgi:Lactate racemase N-terminal domain